MEEGILLSHEREKGILTPARGWMILDMGSVMPQDPTPSQHSKTVESLDPEGQEVGVWLLNGMFWNMCWDSCTAVGLSSMPLSTFSLCMCDNTSIFNCSPS